MDQTPGPSTIASEPLLAVRDLSCERDDRLLFRNLEFAVGEGQVLQIKGGNGSGKTTLLRILCGLYDAYQGTIEWRGQALVEQLEDYHAALLYIGHRVGVNKVLTPLENLRWTMSLQHRVSDEALMAALAQVGLRGFEESPCHALSAGQHQRVSLARLLVRQARLWILDEPFTTLDVNGVALLESLLKSHAEGGGAVLVTTHHPLQLAHLQTLTLGQERLS